MFVDKILNDDNYEVISSKLENIKDIYIKLEKMNDDFRRYITYGLSNLVSKRILTDILKEGGSLYCIGLHSGGLGFYWKHNDYRSRIRTNVYIPTLKTLCTDEVVSYLTKSIKKRSKQIRFLNVIDAIRKYENIDVNVSMDHDLTITDIKNSLNSINGEIIISNFQIMYGHLGGDSFTRILNDMDNSISNFLVFEQLLDEIIELEEKYSNQMKDVMSKNEIVLNKLKTKLSGYLSAEAI